MDEEKGKETIALRSYDAAPPAVEGNKKMQYIATIAVCLGAFTAGTVLSWTSPAQPFLSSNATVLPEPTTTDQDMWIGSLLAIGALVGAIPSGIAAERFGRKWTICSLTIPFIVSWIIIVFSRSLELLYTARVLAGVSTGGICVVAPMYIGEISEGSVRGALGSFFQLLLTIGILFTYVVGACASYTVLAILSGVVPIVFLVVFFFMSETPIYLLKKGKRAEAQNALQTFRGNHYEIAYEMNAMKKAIEEEEENGPGGVGALFKSKANVNALVVGLGLMVFQQLSGVNAVIFYTNFIFTQAGSDLDPSICAIIVGVVQVIITYIATLLVDKAGRRILLLISSSVMCVCLLVLGLYFHLKQQDEASVSSIGWIPLVSVNVFIVCFSLGFGPLPWMMMGELFSSSIKGTASGLAVTLNWTLVFVVTKTFQDLINGLGIAGTFWMFGAITGLACVFVYFRVPETKGKTFLEIQKMLGGD